MSKQIDRFDVGATVVCGGLAWMYDEPVILIVAGVFLMVVSPIAIWLGEKASGRLSTRLNRSDREHVVKLR